MDPLPDADLVRRAKAGDTGAFGALVARHPPRCAEDVRQETLLQAWLSLPKLRDDARFAGWLQGIARNVARAALRRDEAWILGWEDDGAAAEDDLELRWVVRDAVAGLPATSRTAVWLYYFEDLSIAQIARELELSPGAVKTRLYDGRRRLREQLATALPGHHRTEKSMIELRVAELRLIAGRLLAVLTDKPGVLPLWLAPREAPAMFGAELAEAVLEASGAELAQIRIVALPEGLYGTVLTIRTAAGDRIVNTQLGAGLQLAHRRRRSVLVPRELFERLGTVAESAAAMEAVVEAAIAAAGIPLAAARDAGERVAVPRNLDFADGLRYWDLRGPFLRRPEHWQDYTCGTTRDGAFLAAAVPEPYGFADLRQAILADHLRGGRLRFSASLSATGNAGLYLRFIDPDRSGRPEDRVFSTTGEVAADVPADAVYILFGLTLTGPGRIACRDLRLAGD